MPSDVLVDAHGGTERLYAAARIRIQTLSSRTRFSLSIDLQRSMDGAPVATFGVRRRGRRRLSNRCRGMPWRHAPQPFVSRTVRGVPVSHPLRRLRASAGENARPKASTASGSFAGFVANRTQRMVGSASGRPRTAVRVVRGRARASTSRCATPLQSGGSRSPCRRTAETQSSWARTHTGTAPTPGGSTRPVCVW
jgi:hypothetical protein